MEACGKQLDWNCLKHASIDWGEWWHKKAIGSGVHQFPKPSWDACHGKETLLLLRTQTWKTQFHKGHLAFRGKILWSKDNYNMDDWFPEVYLVGYHLFYLSIICLSASLVICMSVLCFAPLHPYIYVSSIFYLSFVHINHLFMYVKLCFIEVSINATLKLIIQACSSRHFLVFQHKGKILPGFHVHNHNAYVSDCETFYETFKENC